MKKYRLMGNPLNDILKITLFLLYHNKILTTKRYKRITKERKLN